MILDNSNYFIFGLIIFIIFFLLVQTNEKRHFDFVKEYWFYKRTYSSRIRVAFYIIGFFLLGISLLDIRGKENKILTSLPDQKTLVLIDCSLSMRVKDVFPDRLRKGVLFVREILKKLDHHKIALMAFSDKADVLVPFTDDFHLINSRLDLIENLNVIKGGSNLNQSIQEAINYVIGNNKVFNSINNIMVITDGDVHDLNFKITENEELNIAILNIGTLNGGPVPKFDKEGNYLSPKTYRGKGVISISNKSYFEKLQEDKNNLKVWNWHVGVAPIFEIFDFFEFKFDRALKKRTRYSREIISHWVASFGVLFLILAFSSSFNKSFNKSFIFILIFLNLNIFSDVNAKSIIEKIKNGGSSRNERLKQAEIFLKEGKLKFSKYLYEENLKVKILENKIKVIFNYGTLFLKMGEIEKGLEILDKLKVYIKNRPEKKLAEEINSNIILAIKKMSKRMKSKLVKDNEAKEKNNIPILKNKNNILSLELFDELKNKKVSVKKNKKVNMGLVLNIINEDQNLQKKIIEINIVNKRKRLNEKDW